MEKTRVQHFRPFFKVRQSNQAFVEAVRPSIRVTDITALASKCGLEKPDVPQDSACVGSLLSAIMANISRYPSARPPLGISRTPAGRIPRWPAAYHVIGGSLRRTEVREMLCNASERR